MPAAVRRSPPLESKPHLGGFTIIELMIVVAVIGLITSIVLPQMKTFALRAKRSERTVMMRAIHRGVVALEDKFPAGGVLAAPANPSLASIAGGKRGPFVPGLGDWKYLTGQPEGYLYYSYSVTGDSSLGILAISASADLDSDGTYNTYVENFEIGTGGEWVLTSITDPDPY